VLCRLTPSEQSAIRLIVCEGLDYQAAARSLGVPVSTINNWKHRALAKLKQIIEEDGLVAPRSRATVEQQQQRMLEAC
jgi:DNA-directed RNA polymerase specialized sigma24 family protein